MQLAPSAYLASVAASSGLISHILPTSLQPLPIPHLDRLDAAVALWSQGYDNPPPSGSAACNQPLLAAKSGLGGPLLAVLVAKSNLGGPILVAKSGLGQLCALLNPG